jgi:hypothetical protein
MELFAITCTTCQARLKVRDPAAIGKILACPKCQSMVQVVAPAGWRPSAPAPAPAPMPESAPHASGVDANSGSVTLNMIPPDFARAAKQAQSTASQKTPAAAKPSSAAPTAATDAVPTTALTTAQAAASAAPLVASNPVTAPVDPYSEINPNDIPPVPMDEPGESLATRLLEGAVRHRLVLLCSPVAALVIALLAWILFRPGDVANAPPSLADSQSVAVDAPADNTDQPVEAVPNTDVVQVAADGAAPGATAEQPKVADTGQDDPAAATQAEQAPAHEDTANADTGSAEPGAEPAAEPAGADQPAATVAARPTTDRALVPAAKQPVSPFAPPQTPAAIENTAADANQAEMAPAAPAANATEPADDDVLVAQESAPQIDVPERLDDPLTAIQFKRVTLADFCDFLSRLSTIPITLDVDGMAAIGARASDLISITAEDTTVGQVLVEVLAKRGLVHVIHGQQLTVTSPEGRAGGEATIRYDVHDLAAAGGDNAGHLATLVARYAAPAAWQEHGGSGRITSSDDELIVEQTSLVQRRVVDFLNKLRVVRGVAAKDTARSEEVSLKTRYSRAKTILDKQVTANFGLETPLCEVLAWLARNTGARILIDEASLDEAGLWCRSPVTVIADHEAFYEVLTGLLTPAGMTYRIVDERTLQVFARRSLPNRLEFEVYPVTGLLANRLDPQEMLARLRDRFDAASWIEGGGLGSVELDEAGKCLLVVQSPESQIRMEHLLLRAQAPNRAAK